MKMLSYAAIVAGGIALMSATPAFAEMVKYKADLTAGEEVPATDSTATGMSDITYDTETMKLTWSVSYEGLTGDATAAHFHGPAAVGENAKPVVPIDGPLASPIEGEATLTEAQAADLDAGMWYFNVHTAKFPDGEIRGQVVKAGAM
ncbi:CHRD domain-containing protein [Devosia rhizoryzae]|uniref:CHRD domain-containing protein n=1 Tax=Devosia rhizoryzae TaxID=2774137 RepID=A0ABX7C480_9HYPH|nr:CHRD domain-containing protein [Devosia rhizoryzae]QQR39037.1 CHRD domain-containing protein [Devosia rhizoryzae]